MTILARSALCLIAAALSACAHVPMESAVGGDAPLKPGTMWVMTSPDWASEARAVYAEATAEVDRREGALPDGGWYVVLDLDETVLNNVGYQASRDRIGAGYTPESWNEWTQLEQATAVPGAVEFIRHVVAAGGNVAFVTNRLDTEQLATESNLAKIGLRRGRDYRVLLTRGSPLGKSAKDARFALVPQMLAVQGYSGAIPLAYVGDAKGDQPTFDAATGFFCIDQGAMYGDPCARVPLSGR